MRVVDLPCSPNAHTRKGDRRWTDAPAQRWIRPMTLSLLGSATWSVLDFVRTNLRTERLAIALRRSQRPGHAPSQVAGGDRPPPVEMKRASLEGLFKVGARPSAHWEINQPSPRRNNERTWREHFSARHRAGAPTGRQRAVGSADLLRHCRVSSVTTGRPKSRNPFQFQRHYCL